MSSLCPLKGFWEGLLQPSLQFPERHVAFSLCTALSVSLSYKDTSQTALLHLN